jgi:hypothetical protein
MRDGRLYGNNPRIKGRGECMNQVAPDPSSLNDLFMGHKRKRAGFTLVEMMGKRAFPFISLRVQVEG